MDSLEHFKLGISEVTQLLSLGAVDTARLPSAHEEQPSLNGTSPVDAGVTLRRSAVVLLVSHFEGYLKRMCEEFVDDLSDRNLTSSQIPKGLRDLHVMPRVRELASSPTVESRLHLMKRFSDISALWNDAAKPPRGTLRPELVARQVTNADSDCIDQLFSIFGLPVGAACDGAIEVHVEGDDDVESRIETHDIRPRLRDIVKCRNDIAHGDASRRPTKADLDRYVAFLEAFASRLNRRKITILDLI